MKRSIAMLLAAIAAGFVAAQGERLDYQMLGRIRDEGLNRSQVMDHVVWLSDVYGPRLTGIAGNPAGERVGDEEVPANGGWPTFTRSAGASAKAGRSSVSPRTSSSRRSSRSSASRRSGRRAPKARSPLTWSASRSRTRPTSTNTAASCAARSSSPSRRAGCRMLEGPIILRMTDADIAEAETTPIPPAAGGRRPRRSGGCAFRQKVSDFYAQEGVVAVFDRGSDGDMAAGGSDLSWQQQHPDGGTIFPNGASAARRQGRQGRAGDRARGRALQPDDPRPRQGCAGEGGAQRRDEVLRRDDAERLQHDRRDAGHRSRVGDRAARRALRLAPVRHRRHRQRHRQRRDDGSDADSQGGRRQAAAHHPRRRCGAARSRGCSARAPTFAITSPTSTRWR